MMRYFIEDEKNHHTQEMLAKGFLAGNSVYVCTEHTDDIVVRYFEELYPIFAINKDCEQGRDASTFLKGRLYHAGFRRLN